MKRLSLFWHVISLGMILSLPLDVEFHPKPHSAVGNGSIPTQSIPTSSLSDPDTTKTPDTMTTTFIENGLLRRGDHVTIISTARKVTPQKMQPSIDLFRSWGLVVDIDPRLYLEDNQMAGPDSNRLAMLQDAINNPDIKAIFCARGGYGTVRIIDSVDFSPLKHNPKWIIGFSDVTVLHSHLHNLGFESLHAIMPISISAGTNRSNNPAIASLYNVLFRGHDHVEFNSHEFNRPGTAEAQVVGGNLSILYSLLASDSDIDTDGKILLIEDLDEYLYHIDRMMMALKRAGKLKNLKGLIVGGLTQMHDNEIPFGRNAEEIVRDAVAEYNYPVCFNAPYGHIGSRNHALPLGKKIRMTVGNKTVIDI